MTTARPRICGGGADADHPARRVRHGTAGEPFVQGRGHSDHLFELPAVSGSQRSADDRDDARARREGVAPRPRDRQRDVADARRSIRDRRGTERESFGAEDGESARRIPPRQFGRRLLPIGRRDRHAILAPERAGIGQDDVAGVGDAADRPAPPVHLNDRRRDRVDGGRHLFRQC